MILRIAVLNNFNFTDKEFEQIEGYKGMNMFVNSNSFVKVKPGIKSIVTINPYLKFYMNENSDIQDVSAFRVKVVGDAKPEVKEQEQKAMDYCKKVNKPILVTFMRFISKETRDKYAIFNGHYKFKRGYWYYNHDRKIELVKILKRKYGELIHVCDLKEKGCPSCMNCAKLTYGREDEIYQVDLSSSGYCPFNCPDCFAKRLVRLGKNRIAFDLLKKNDKMKGYKKQKI